MVPWSITSHYTQLRKVIAYTIGAARYSTLSDRLVSTALHKSTSLSALCKTSRANTNG
jgi:hypothetical protein